LPIRSWLRALLSRLSDTPEAAHRPRRRGVPPRLQALEDRLAPVSSLAAAGATFNLAAGATGGTVTRSGDLTPQVTIGYAIRAGTATSGTNFTAAATGTLFFASGVTTQTVPFTVLSNNFPEATRTFSVDLTGVIDVLGPPPTFAAQQTFATGYSPRSVAVTDVNGAGRPAPLLANSNSGTASVLLNTTAPGATTPSFAAQQTFATGLNPYSVAAADVNGDGRPDLLVANRSSATASVLLNTTAPGATAASFAAQQTFATATSPFSVAVGAVNGDGRPDLLAANNGSASVSVLLNTTAPGATTPAFATQQTFATGIAPVSVAVADVNGDGRPDLLVANYSSATVSVLLNTTPPGATAASLAAHPTLPTATPPTS